MMFFVIVGVLGLLFLLASTIFGHDGDTDVGHDVVHDFGHDGDSATGPGLFSVFTISWFAMGFGGGGTAAKLNDLGTAASSFVGLATGMAFWGVAFFAMGLLHKQQADSTLTTEKLIGSKATVTMKIPAGGKGKISCTASGETHELIAISREVELPVGASVRIVEEQGGVYIVE